ncbi:S1C family serine protease [Desulfatibacillum aliphaticivorans]|uniref:S1C family serine protease n=1 Tax=Desulfatibacillum aliphaticivorans TaxID=218208 RepID=UPI0003FF3608|nr:S1C family serine protease [Desulfatibacillum aliphaticivorans]
MNRKFTNSAVHIFVLVAALSLLAGCATTPKRTDARMPIVIDPEGSATVTFQRLIVRFPSGATIGTHHDGLLRVPQYRHYWTSDLAVASSEFKVIASELMASYGYSVLGGDNLLFGKDNSGKAEYQLGGTIKDIQYDTYAPLAGNFSEAQLTIEWQLYNTYKESVVYKTTTDGSGKQQYTVGSECVKAAFRGALENLLADPSFVAILKQSPHEEWDETPNDFSPVIINCDRKKAIKLPEDLDLAMQSVITIKAGETVGAGVLISEDGLALTAGHVVSELERVSVSLKSGITLMANVVRFDEQQDIALISLPGQGYKYASMHLGPHSNIGTDVFALGAPTGEKLSYTVTKGIISGYREWAGKKYIQTDVALNAGNSGGPLFSPDGEVLGIVSWKIAGIGIEGLAFGVPVEAISERLNIKWQ